MQSCTVENVNISKFTWEASKSKTIFSAGKKLSCLTILPILFWLSSMGRSLLKLCYLAANFTMFAFETAIW